jgi:hypothetical protein
MKINLKITAACTALLFFSACANPQIAAPVGPAEYEQDCKQLDMEIRKAEGLRIAARDEDRFDWKYILVANAFVSAYRMNKAEIAAQERLNDLKRIATEKECPIPDVSPMGQLPNGAAASEQSAPVINRTPRQTITQATPATPMVKTPVAKDSYK